MNCIHFTNEEKYINDFIKLTKKLYSKYDNMEDAKDMKALLKGEHPLSGYFKLYPFVVYDNKQVVGRFGITVYPNDTTAYLGFYECVDRDEVAKVIFTEAEAFAEKLGCRRMEGPVDASFWIKYRMKINLFDRLPYTGEPYNKEYYLKQFTDNGFRVSQHYTSNIYEPLEPENKDPLYDNRLAMFQEKGYEIKSPDIKDYDVILGQLYKLLTELYSDFPIYKDLSEEDFRKVFNNYRYILNLSMVKMAYYKEQPVGFLVSVPDYGNKVYHLNNPMNLLKIFKLKKKPKQYVMLYMGVDQSHRGLGKALVGSIMEELRMNGLPSIGALARDGKITQKYGSDYIEQLYEYVLLEKSISERNKSEG